MIYSSWDIEQNILKLVILGYFLPFYPLKTSKITILKNEKICWTYRFTLVYQKSVIMMYGSWDMECDRQNVLSLWTAFNLLLPYGPIKSKFWKNEKNTWRYYHFTNVYHKWQSYDMWFFIYGVQQTDFFVILHRFLPFYPPNNPKNQNFEKLKKAPGDTIILQKCTKNHGHMLHYSLDMARNGFVIFHFGLLFTFTSLTAQKIKI